MDTTNSLDQFRITPAKKQLSKSITRVACLLDSLGSEEIRQHLLNKLLNDPSCSEKICSLFSENDFPQLKRKRDSEDDKEKPPKVKKKRKDPNHPKRPMTGYMLFLQEIRPKLKEQHPELKATEIVKKAADMWGKMTAEAKKPYEEQSSINKQEYQRAKSEYLNSPKGEKTESLLNGVSGVSGEIVEEFASPFSNSVNEQLHRLGGVLTRPQHSRLYNNQQIPYTIQVFCDIHWTKGTTFKVNKYNIKQVMFSKEYTIENRSEFNFLRKYMDAILIARGRVNVAALMNDVQQDISDFNVYILHDDAKDEVYGPFKLSEFLSWCEFE